MLKKHHKIPAGFTLLELLISLTILSVIIVIVFGAFRIGIRAWEKGEAETDHQQRIRTVLNMMREQFASVYRSEPSARIPGMTGDADGVAFVSRRQMLPENRFQTVYVHYRVERGTDGGRLMIRESPFSSSQTEDAVSDDPYVELLDGFYRLEFEYIRQTEEEGGLKNEFVRQNSWDSEAEKTLPRAVRVVFQGRADTPPVAILASLGRTGGQERAAIFGGGG